MRWLVLLLAGLAVAAPAAAQVTPAAVGPVAGLRPEPVDVVLVLLSDVSGSVNDGEFHLEKQGYRAAFADPGVVAAIRSGMRGRIAVAYVEFAGARQQHVVVGWTVLARGRDARAFGEAVATAPRSFAGRTSISDGILAALALLRRAPFVAPRRVIDVCGDGANNSGPAIAAAHAAAARARVAINAIAIINKWPEGYLYGAYRVPGGLTRYFRDQVIGGPGSFVVEAKDFASFAEAMRRKLRQEIAGR